MDFTIKDLDDLCYLVEEKIAHIIVNGSSDEDLEEWKALQKKVYNSKMALHLNQ